MTVATGANSLARFSTFLDQRHRDIADHTALSREVLDDYLSWTASRPIAASTRSLDLTFVKIFLDWARRHRSLPGLPDAAVIYHEEVTRPDDAVPRFVPEFVMAQLESETNLARIANTSTRHLVVVLIETGLRGGDACKLAFNPMFDDSVGSPCLRFHNSKIGAEQLIPLSAKAAAAIAAQQAHVADCWPNGSPWLFPGILDNPDGAKPYAHASLSGQLGRWLWHTACPTGTLYNGPSCPHGIALHSLPVQA